MTGINSLWASVGGNNSQLGASTHQLAGFVQVRLDNAHLCFFLGYIDKNNDLMMCHK